MMPYQKLTAWRAAHELALAIYRATDRFPKTELYGLTSQLRRAAFSVAANIAEGVAKRGNGEFRRYLDISIGSLSEISYTTLLAKDLGLLAPENAHDLETRREQAAKLTWGLYKSVSRNGEKRAKPA
jgi:four helix bundle protein